jgi:ATP-dependent Clp protease ATP-binding subunit ClpA
MQTLPGSALDPDASAVMKACNVDLGALKKKLADYLDNELRGLVNPDDDDARPASAFQRVIQRAVFDVQSSDSKEVTGAKVPVHVRRERKPRRMAPWRAEYAPARRCELHGLVHGLVKESGATLIGRGHAPTAQ